MPGTSEFGDRPLGSQLVPRRARQPVRLRSATNATRQPTSDRRVAGERHLRGRPLHTTGERCSPPLPRLAAVSSASAVGGMSSAIGETSSAAARAIRSSTSTRSIPALNPAQPQLRDRPPGRLEFPRQLRVGEASYAPAVRSRLPAASRQLGPAGFASLPFLEARPIMMIVVVDRVDIPRPVPP